MPRTTRRNRNVSFGLTILVLVAGLWIAQQHGLISMPSSCGRHMKITDQRYVVRRLHLTTVKKRDNHIVAIEGQDTNTGERITIGTIQHNNPDEPTIPQVRTLRAGKTYAMRIFVVTEADTHKGCGKPKLYDYLVGVAEISKVETAPRHVPTTTA